MLRERGSSVKPRALWEHDPADPNCELAELGPMLKDTASEACCAICGERLAREQAASAINARELGS